MQTIHEQVRIEKLVHGGQGLGTLSNGKKIFVWNALPGELATVQLRKSKKGHSEGIATAIVEPAAERIAPVDDAYLSTSPWQIMTMAAEQQYKAEILNETFMREHVALPAPITMDGVVPEPFHYRNKMEYSFWGDDAGLHLALYHRASHGKRIVTGSSLAMPAIDAAANAVNAALNKHGIRASSLKTVMARCNQAGKTVAAVFVKDENFAEIPELAATAGGAVVYYSNPKSPASIVTRELYSYGDTDLSDSLLGHDIHYNVTSFFQVNQPVFGRALHAIREFVDGDTDITDMYAGVGGIGIAVGANTIVEIDPHNIELAQRNVAGTTTAVVAAAAEKALEHIGTGTLIVDPPRAGLHAQVTARILEASPRRVAYLSCNPITQARDVALLQDHYRIMTVTGYNFFPRTPHIECLVLLEHK